MVLAYLTIHSAVPSNNLPHATFVNVATDKAQYAPLISTSPSLCMQNEPSGNLNDHRNFLNFSLSIILYAFGVPIITKAFIAA